MKNAFQHIRSSFQSEDSKFVLFTALKVLSIGIIIFSFLIYIFYNLIGIQSIYFESLGFSNAIGMREAFFDFIMEDSLRWMPWIFVFFIALFLSGISIAKSLLRPFENISVYALEAIEKENQPYNNDYFSGFRLLTNFSEFFFTFINSCRLENLLKSNVVPPQYTKIHKPVFDKVFFFHFSLFLGTLCLINALFIHILAIELHESLVRFSLKVLDNSSPNVVYFLGRQSEVFISISYLGLFISCISYLILGFHLYDKVSGAAFGIFSTMRSFMKGNFNARVHLIGYNYVRPLTRNLNKYLDFIVKKYLPKNQEKG